MEGGERGSRVEEAEVGAMKKRSEAGRCVEVMVVAEDEGCEGGRR